jgi:hypothetical protein
MKMFVVRYSPSSLLASAYLLNNALLQALTSSSTLLPAPTDDTTIYTGLNQQSSYHRMANSIYHRLLSSPAVTPKDVDEAQQKIDAWHRSLSFCVQLGYRSARPEWHFTARRRQILCDQSLRLLIYRPMLLHWYGLRGSSPNSNSEPTYQDQDTAGEARCRAQGLKIARTTIAMITDSFSNRHYSRLTLSFTLWGSLICGTAPPTTSCNDADNFQVGLLPCSNCPPYPCEDRPLVLGIHILHAGPGESQNRT